MVSTASSTRPEKRQFNLDEFRKSYAGLTPAAAVEVTARKVREANIAQSRHRKVRNVKVRPIEGGQPRLPIPYVDKPKETPFKENVPPVTLLQSSPKKAQTKQVKKSVREKKSKPSVPAKKESSPSELELAKLALKAAENTVLDLTEKLRAENSKAQKAEILIIETDELKKALSAKKIEATTLNEQLMASQSTAESLKGQLLDLQAQIKLNTGMGKVGRRSKPETVAVGHGRERRTVTVIRGQSISPRSGKLTLKGVSPDVAASMIEKASPSVKKVSDNVLPSYAQRLVTLLEMTLMGVDPETSSAAICERAVRGIEQVKNGLDKLTLTLMGRAAVA